MAVRLDKPWQPIDVALKRLRGQMGVYQLADSDGRVLWIGFAGGRALFGLRGEVQAQAAELGAAQVRAEITTAYHSRYRELLMAHVADHGELPPENVRRGAVPTTLGRLSLT